MRNGKEAGRKPRSPASPKCFSYIWVNMPLHESERKAAVTSNAQLFMQMVISGLPVTRPKSDRPTNLLLQYD